MSFLSKIFNLVSCDIGIDLGTANTLVYVKGKGIVLNEPSVVATINENGVELPYAFGSEARMMIGRTPTRIKTIKPLKDGVIADFRMAEEMIKFFVKSVQEKHHIIRPLILVCVPSGSTSVERRAIQDAAENAGAREAFLVEEPMAAALGAGLPVTNYAGSMIVDIGGGTTEVAIISIGGIAEGKSIRIGGDRMGEAITEYVRKKYNMLIGEVTADTIKHTIGAAMLLDNQENKTLKIKGRDLQDGIPKEITISQRDVVIAIKEEVDAIIEAVKTILESVPPELSADVSDRGIVVTGGGALIQNIDKAISHGTGLPTFVADDALNCVINGIGKMLEDLEEYKGVVFRQN